MDSLAQADPEERRKGSFWKNPLAWITEHSFGRGFWTYFVAVFCFDAGYGVFFFLFNLYLLDLGFGEKLMGWVAGAMTIGSVLAMMPVGWLSKKIGVKPLIITCFLASPLLTGCAPFTFGGRRRLRLHYSPVQQCLPERYVICRQSPVSQRIRIGLEPSLSSSLRVWARARSAGSFADICPRGSNQRAFRCILRI